MQENAGTGKDLSNKQESKIGASKEIVPPVEITGNQVILTKLQKILLERRIGQSELSQMILDKFGVYYAKGPVSKFVTGKVKNVTVRTAQHFAKTLGLRVDDILEDLT